MPTAPHFHATSALHALPLRSPLAVPAREPALVPAVSKAIAVLDRLADRGEPMSLARLASDLALPKSSVHGLCNTLVSFGYLKRETDGTFRIGPRVMGLAAAFVSGTDVSREFGAMGIPPGPAADETTVLSVLSGGDALYVAVRNSTRPLGLAFHVGQRLPAYLSGSGKAMLAFLDPDEVDRRLAGGLSVRLTPRGPRSLAGLKRELALTRKRGWSIDEGAVREGVQSFGVPVFDAAGHVAAAVAVCVNRARLGADRGAAYRDAAIAIARELTDRIGGRVPGDAEARRQAA